MIEEPFVDDMEGLSMMYNSVSGYLQRSYVEKMMERPIITPSDFGSISVHHDEGKKIYRNPRTEWLEKCEKEDLERQKLSGRKKMSRFEKARLIGTRAIQIANNSKLMIDCPNEGDYLRPLDLAKKEYKQGKCPLVTVRGHFGSYEIGIPSLENV